MTNVRQIIINSPKYGQKICLVDEEDFELVSKYSWVLEKGRTTFYAIYSRKFTSGDRITIRMHQLILNIKPETNGKRSIKTDHINHNGLDNRRSNIRVCTNSQNGANSRKARTNKLTPYKGVTIKRYKGGKFRYCARIRVNDNLIHLGNFIDPKVAALKYNEAAKKYFGEYSYINEV